MYSIRKLRAVLENIYDLQSIIEELMLYQMVSYQELENLKHQRYNALLQASYTYHFIDINMILSEDIIEDIIRHFAYNIDDMNNQEEISSDSDDDDDERKSDTEDHEHKSNNTYHSYSFHGNVLFVGFHNQKLPKVNKGKYIVSVDPAYNFHGKSKNVTYINKHVNKGLLDTMNKKYKDTFHSIVFDWSVWKFFEIETYEPILLGMFKLLTVGGYIIINKKEFFSGPWGRLSVNINQLEKIVDKSLNDRENTIIPFYDPFIVQNNGGDWPQKIQKKHVLGKQKAERRWKAFLFKNRIEIQEITNPENNKIYLKLIKR